VSDAKLKGVSIKKHKTMGNKGKRRYHYRKQQRSSSSALLSSSENGGGADEAECDDGDDAKDDLLSNNTNYNSSNKIFFHWSTSKDLVRYLKEYRKGCLNYYKQTRWDKERGIAIDSAATTKKCDATNGIFATNWTTQPRQQPSQGEQSRTIGGVAFPILTEQIFQEPCMVLDMDLSSRQRKTVHDCCIEADLYHTTITVQQRYGDDDDGGDGGEGSVNQRPPPRRVVVISLYADGFEDVSSSVVLPEGGGGEQKQPESRPVCVHRFRPWVYRQEQQLPAVFVNGSSCCSTTTPPLRDEDDLFRDGTTTKESKMDDATVVCNNIAHPLTPERVQVIRDFSPAGSMEDSVATPLHSNGTRSVKEYHEERAIEAIYRLIDQPQQCLRRDVDTLVYRKLHAASLADVTPPSGHNGADWELVDTPVKMKRCVEEISTAKPSEIAFDVEAYNPSKYAQLTCMLQITSTAGKEYVIDVLAPGVWDEVHGLAPFFLDPSIVKIGHSIGGLDVRSLHRDFGIFVVNAFDTYEAAKELGLDSHGLAAVCDYYGLPNCDVYRDLKERYQKCDWRLRPLTEPMMRYGRYDIHYLILLRRLMMRDMVRGQFWDRKGSREQDVEDRLVSESLRQTLMSIEMAEDGIVDDDGDFVSPNKRRQDALDLAGPMTDNDFGDDQSFKTSLQRSTSDDDIFFTPSNSLHGISITEDEDADGPIDRTADIAIDDLFLHPVLMRCLALSQDRCRELWSDKRDEPHLKNTLFTLLIKRWKKKQIEWHPSSTELYDELYHWRNRVASELECLPGFVAPLEFLVCIAWKRPTTDVSLRRISCELPPALEERNDLRDHLLDLVLSKSLMGGRTLSATVLYYSTLGISKGRGTTFAKTGMGMGRTVSRFIGASMLIGIVAAVLKVHVVKSKRK
jgi:ribonuclease D